MQRWQLFSLLSASALLAAALLPRSSQEAPASLPPPAAPELIPASSQLTSGDLHLRAGLDRAVISGEDRERYLVFEVRAEEKDGPRAPVDLSLVVDVSGSMSAERKIEYAYLAARELVAQLDERDRFSLVTFDDRAALAIPPGPVVDRSAIYRTIDAMYRGGGTSLLAGLALGLEQMAAPGDGRSRRVVMLSDGQDSSPIEQLASLASRHQEAGISVSALGVGLDFDEKKLQAISQAGGGRYRYVSNPTQLSAMFQDELSRAGSVASRSVRLELEVAEGVELLEVYGYDGYSGGAQVGGWSAFLGDVYSGQTRKFVARVRLPATLSSEQEVAKFEAHFINAEGGAEVVVFGVRAAPGTPAAVSRSADALSGEHAARAVAGVAMLEAGEHWSAGDNQTARASASARVQELEVLGHAFGAELVEKPIQALQARLVRQESVVAGTREFREAELEQLKALGYVE